MNRMWILAGLIWGSVAAALAADLRLATVFSDHMVLQRDKPVPVWGWADPGERVTVAFGGQSKTATAGPDGKWMVKLDPMPASATPGVMLVKSERPDRAARADDVLVGEVWLGSGQSNMAMTMGSALNPEEEKATSNLPLIRHFREASAAAPSPRMDAGGEWVVCAPDTVGGFSGTLFFFGREVHRSLGVPVGLINSSVGGTPIEGWISPEAQAGSADLSEIYHAQVKEYEAFDQTEARVRHEKAMEHWETRAANARQSGRPVPRKPRDPVESHKHKGAPGHLFNGKIAPLIPYAIRGALWYQGEANSHPGKGLLYRHQLPLLVKDWRSLWGDEFPFAWVQLPNFEREGDGWMLVQEAMLMSLRVPCTGMAITLGIGDPDDIHPKNKQDVGKRLALWALGEVYKTPVPAVSGPLPAGHVIRGSDVIVSFTHATGGLKARGGELKGFEVAGSDRKWNAATARIDGKTVVVSSPAAPNPVAVRYAWASNPEASLENGVGLPASPFRTDDWNDPTLGSETP